MNKDLQSNSTDISNKKAHEDLLVATKSVDLIIIFGLFIVIGGWSVIGLIANFLTSIF